MGSHHMHVELVGARTGSAVIIELTHLRNFTISLPGRYWWTSAAFQLPGSLGPCNARAGPCLRRYRGSPLPANAWGWPAAATMPILNGVWV